MFVYQRVAKMVVSWGFLLIFHAMMDCWLIRINPTALRQSMASWEMPNQWMFYSNGKTIYKWGVFNCHM